MHSELAGDRGRCHEAGMRGGTVPCRLQQPSRLLLLCRELDRPGRSGVQQHEAAERRSEAEPPQRRPRLPEEKLAQDGLKEKTEKVLSGQAAAKPPVLPELQGLLLGEPALEKTCLRKLLLGPPREMAAAGDAKDNLLCNPACKHSHIADPKQDSGRRTCVLLPSQHLSGAKCAVDWVTPVDQKGPRCLRFCTPPWL